MRQNMSDFQENNDTKPVPAQRSERAVPLDAQLLSEAVIELNISRKNVGIYPPGHIQITTSIERAYLILQKMFEIREEMTLGVAKDTLLVGQDYLDQKNPVYRDFALSMSQQGIAAVTFIKGLEKEELVRFHRILTTKPEEIRTAGGIGRVMDDADIPHISIHAIDYTSFHVTEEQEIFKPQTKGTAGEKAGSALWQDFVSYLSAGTLAGPGEGVSAKDAVQIDPAELARLLNERKLDPGAALQSYDHIISEHMRDRVAKRSFSKDQSTTLANMSKLLNELHPELRKQFLSVAFSRISANTASAGSDDILGGLPDDMVIAMLRQASSEGREISPTLTGLLGKLSKAHAQGEATGGFPKEKKGQTPEGPEFANILPEHMEKLFDREKYEEYVSEDYEAMLKRLTDGVASGEDQFPVEEYAKTFEDEHVDFQIGRALLAFLEEDIDEEDYVEFAKKLVAIMPGFLVTGNFMLLWDISETLRRHRIEKSTKGIRAAAEEALQAFSNPEFISQALHSFEVWMKDKGQEAVGLIQALGSATIPGLMDIYGRDESMGGKRVVFNLLSMFGDPAVREAHKRLRDPRPYYVRNLVMFIRRVGTHNSIPYIKPLLKHQDLGIKVEALSALLKFKDPGSLKLLRDAILGADPDFAFRAMALAGQYRINDATLDILSKMKRVIIFETDYAENEEVIKALGEIGDPRAIPDLEKLARATWSLYPQSLKRMKELLFESLSRYPRESLSGLLKIGERLDSEKIKRTCSSLGEKK